MNIRSSGVTTSLSKSFKIQLRVINALIMREIITRYGRHNIGFLWLFVEPMLFTLGIITLWTAAKMDHGSSIPIVAFAITGYSSVLLWRNASSRCAKAIEPNLSLMYHRNVKVIDIFASRLILEIAGATVSIVGLTLFFSAIGWMKLPYDLLMAVEGWMLLIWFTIALGFIVGAVSERSETFERVWHIALYLLFPLSGAVYMIEWMPVAAQKILLYIPMVHGTEMIRHGYFGEVVPTYEDPIYFATVNIIMTLVGLALVRDTGRRVEPE